MNALAEAKWGVYMQSQAKFAQSHQRRFSRWLHNSRIHVQRVYSPLIVAALAQWGVSKITVIEDTTMLWDEYCLIRFSIQYRGRAIPLVWRVLHYGSSSVRSIGLPTDAETGCTISARWCISAISSRPWREPIRN
ncbi:hypothetical protein H6F50_18785 [Coleofasciculus sp. FACHB-712]|uniref:hypothetical protein n=1 Tax=Coleofasciculus sp. FACHB-712 TaxID=2692789 RepID=UPI00168804EF|nr:hypothetical protein [Coleofasciculus sp. FACHB-712]MBD1944375.1 hypothetical protein [Coleofasciculus sp. FACHB-712]